MNVEIGLGIGLVLGLGIGLVLGLIVVIVEMGWIGVECYAGT